MPYDDDLTPVRVIREHWRWFPAWAVILATVLVVGGLITWGGSEFGWWLNGQAASHQYSQTVRSQAYQASLIAEMQQHLANISGPGGVAATRAGIPASSPEQAVLRAQELSEIRELCAESATLIPLSPASDQLMQVVTANCLAGVPVATPPLASPVPQGS